MTDKQSKVWLNLTQQELDDAYDQSIYAPNRQQILHRYHHNSDRTRQRLASPAQFRLTYRTTQHTFCHLILSLIDRMDGHCLVTPLIIHPVLRCSCIPPENRPLYNYWLKQIFNPQAG